MTKIKTLGSTVRKYMDKLTDFERVDSAMHTAIWEIGRLLGKIIRIISLFIMSVFMMYCFGVIAPEFREMMPQLYGTIDILTANSAKFLEWCWSVILKVLEWFSSVILQVLQWWKGYSSVMERVAFFHY